MIKIFAGNDDIAIINSWRETHQVTVEAEDTDSASEFGLTEFPVIVKVEGSSVVKTYGTGIKEILNISFDTIIEEINV
jgi:hypothetical protein